MGKVLRQTKQAPKGKSKGSDVYLGILAAFFHLLDAFNDAPRAFFWRITFAGG
jgi:hypothetical protein